MIRTTPITNTQTVNHPSLISEVRKSSQLSQSSFALLLGISVRTLQEWEQGRSNPSGAAQTLLKIAHKHPAILRELADV